MKRVIYAILVLSATVMWSSCIKHQQTVRPLAPTAAGPNLPASEPDVIGYLEHRDRIVIIKSAEQGPVYSARNKDGKVLFENLTSEQLKMQSPDIHGFIEGATAGHAGLSDLIMMKLR